ADSWYCFRCHAGGDVIALVRRHERLSFVDACARLDALPPAARAAPRRPAETPPPERSWERLTLDEQVVMDTAAHLYRHRLWQEPRARAYLASRGLPDSLVRAAGLR